MITEIKVGLTKKEMSQKDLAKMIGISQKSLSSKLKGKTPFKLIEAQKIVDILEINPSIFFTHSVP